MKATRACDRSSSNAHAHIATTACKTGDFTSGPYLTFLMLIPIIFNSSTSSKLPSTLAKISNDEVVLIELQGMLEVEVAQPTDKNGKLVGKLTINEDESVSGSKK